MRALARWGVTPLLAAPLGAHALGFFERYGIDHPGYLTRFEFKVTTSGGRSVVQVSSREPVTEPFVTLLVEATWARGRRLREYTVLLDPPILLPGQSTSQGA